VDGEAIDNQYDSYLRSPITVPMIATIDENGRIIIIFKLTFISILSLIHYLSLWLITILSMPQPHFPIPKFKNIIK